MSARERQGMTAYATGIINPCCIAPVIPVIIPQHRERKSLFGGAADGKRFPGTFLASFFWVGKRRIGPRGLSGS